MIYRGNFRKQYRRGTRILNRGGEPLPLFIMRQNTERVVGYCCPDCGGVHSRLHQRWGGAKCRPNKAFEKLELEFAHRKATECHGRSTCEECGSLFKNQGYAQIKCRDCEQRRWKLNDKLKLAKATRITSEQNQTDWIYCEERQNHNEGYFHDFGELEEYCEDEGLSMPCYVHPCYEMRVKLDAESILEHALEELHEDTAEHVCAKHEGRLQRLLDAWVKHANIPPSYMADARKVIVLDVARFDTLIRTGEDPGDHEIEAAEENAA